MMLTVVVKISAHVAELHGRMDRPTGLGLGQTKGICPRG